MDCGTGCVVVCCNLQQTGGEGVLVAAEELAGRGGVLGRHYSIAQHSSVLTCWAGHRLSRLAGYTSPAEQCSAVQNTAVQLTSLYTAGQLSNLLLAARPVMYHSQQYTTTGVLHRCNAISSINNLCLNNREYQE